MTKELKTSSGNLYNAKYRISSSPSATIFFNLCLMVYYYIIFCRGRKNDLKALKLPAF